LEQALAIGDADKRREIMADLESILQNEGVIIQPYWRALHRYYKDGLVNAEMHPTFEIHVHNIGWAA
ncbi:MAG: diguanylate cyclase, partial [Albidovulum sp.]|nr:diguanylate cyclase [Albidovulum sp.]